MKKITTAKKITVLAIIAAASAFALWMIKNSKIKPVADSLQPTRRVGNKTKHLTNAFSRAKNRSVAGMNAATENEG